MAIQILLLLRRWFRHWQRSVNARWISSNKKYLPFLIAIGFMKFSVMLLLVSAATKRGHPGGENTISLLPDSVEPAVAENQDTIRYWQALENLEGAEIEPTAINRTKDSSIWLVYNRIPRSGGLTLVFLMKELAKANRFSHQRHQYRTPWSRLMLDEEMRNLVTWFEYQHQAKSYDRHFLYINFTQYQRYAKNLKPTYINIVRDPIELAYSIYRGKRSQDPIQVTKEITRRDAVQPGSGMEWYSKSFADCVLEEDSECDFNSTHTAFSRSIPYFCGQDPRCLVKGSKWALQRAKFVIENEYSVVGVVDHANGTHFERTLRVLQHYVPRFFAGAHQVYFHTGYRRRHENRDIKSHPTLAEDVRDKLRNLLSDEYELYEFCQQRLYHQYQRTMDTH